jgi:hypothetical protein
VEFLACATSSGPAFVGGSPLFVGTNNTADPRAAMILAGS